MGDIKDKETKKMSYEELENVASQLSQQVQHLYAKLQQADTTNIISRLQFLFKVVENRNAFTNKDFVDKCVKEIEDIITLQDSEEDNNE